MALVASSTLTLIEDRQIAREVKEIEAAKEAANMGQRTDCGVEVKLILAQRHH
jgi:hypothetical protein